MPPRRAGACWHAGCGINASHCSLKPFVCRTRARVDPALCRPSDRIGVYSMCCVMRVPNAARAASGFASGRACVQHFGYPAAFVVPGTESKGLLAPGLRHAGLRGGACGEPSDEPVATGRPVASSGSLSRFPSHSRLADEVGVACMMSSARRGRDRAAFRLRA